MSSIHDERYRRTIEALRAIREERGINQTTIAERLNQPQPFVAKVEGFERRLDLIELIDWLAALEFDLYDFIERAGIYNGQRGLRAVFVPEESYKGAIAVPVDAREENGGVIQVLRWKDEQREVYLAGISLDQYRLVEAQISATFAALNNSKKLKNRDAIAQALRLAVDELPDLNPSDIYQHIVYRLYIREYTKSNSEQSWKRASGEAIEFFIADRYNPVLLPHGISVKVLIAEEDAISALTEIGIYGQVGDSKLDVGLYGTKNGTTYLFGGVHCKASLAERVSDDVDCSLAMMQRGYVSFLYTFDSKSFPPPTGDLINRGELGSEEATTDKRRYIEEFGQFEACFSYNTRGNASPEKTKSGKRIYVSTFKPEEDNFPILVIQAWEKFSANL